MKNTASPSAWYRLIRERDRGLAAGKKRWYDPAYDYSDWPTMSLPGYWADGRLGHVNGVVWFRRDFIVPDSMAGKPAKLLMGTIVDSDEIYINGRLVGTTSYQYPPRRYDVPADLLKAGRNTIVARVVNTSGRGGFVKNKPYQLSVEGWTIDLKGRWRYKLGAIMDPLPPTTFIQYKPLGLYNGMIAPLLNCAVKGVIWYQGESNTGRGLEYRKLFPALITDWRKNWNRGKFPFLYVQLANFMKAKAQPSESGWAELREAQLKTLAVPNTAMAVTIDIGEWNDIHPLNKKDVGERLALAARKLAYGDRRLVHSGPIYKSVKIKDGKAVISFTNTGGGLVAKGGELKQFAIAGRDKKPVVSLSNPFVWANAKIKGKKVIVWSDKVTDPVAVRYAWADNPEGANLYNKQGLPASPFRTDD
jgi:sialate O-acetylesterase